MTPIENAAAAIRLAHAQSIREERPLEAIRIIAEPFASLGPADQRYWVRLAESAHIALEASYADRVHRAVRTLQTMGCDPDEPCLTTGEVLRMLGVRVEAPEGSNRG